MKKSFNNRFAKFNYCTSVENAFSAIKMGKAGLYTLLWVVEGMVVLLIDDKMVSVSKNQMISITPINHVKMIENHSKVSIIQFNREFYCIKENDREVSCNGILFFGSQGTPIINIDPKNIISFKKLVEELQEEFEITDNIQEEMLTVILKKWLIKCTRVLKQQKNYVGENEVKFELVRQFRILLEINYKKYHKVSDYAKMLNKSPKTISNRFNSLDVLSPSTMILERIYVEAKRYLLFTELSIKEIACNLGFEDISSFSHFFKNKANFSPKQFRDNQHKGY